MSDRRPWLIIGGAIVLAAAIIGGTLIVTAGSDPAPASEVADVQDLPDGTTPTPGQSAYLQAVNPSLTPEHAADVLAVLGSGEDGVCGVWLHPSDPATQAQAVQMLMSSSGYNQTEATVIARAAAEHLCPDK